MTAPSFLRQTRTLTEMRVSNYVYNEIAKRFREAQYHHVFGSDGTLDMSGIGLTVQPLQTIAEEPPIELKSDPAEFENVRTGAKTFEIRMNDRPYKVGSILRLRETECTGVAMREMGAPLVYTGREVYALVTHINEPGTYNVHSTLCLMSIQLVDVIDVSGSKP